MVDVQIANSFHLNTGNYRQRNAFQIKGFVREFKMKENIPQGQISPIASFVLGSFRVSSHSAYFCPLYRRCRISCFPVYKLVRFYVNSSKNLVCRYPLQRPFQIFFLTILLFLFSVWKAVDILFRTV